MKIDVVTNINKLLSRLETEDAKQREKDLPRHLRNRSIPRDTAEFLSVFSRSIGAKVIVEIGTSVGYSTIWLAMTAKSLGGVVHTYEVDEEKMKKAKANIHEAKLDDVVVFHLGGPGEADFPDDIDLIFFDQEKEDYKEHFKILFPKLRPGGTVIADNILSHFEHLRSYIDYVRDHPFCNSVLIPVGKGLEITYKFVKDEFPAFKNEVIIR